MKVRILSKHKLKMSFFQPQVFEVISWMNWRINEGVEPCNGVPKKVDCMQWRAKLHDGVFHGKKFIFLEKIQLHTRIGEIQRVKCGESLQDSTEHCSRHFPVKLTIAKGEFLQVTWLIWTITCTLKP